LILRAYFLIILIAISIVFIATVPVKAEDPASPKLKIEDNKNEGPIVDKNIDYSPVGKKDPFESFVIELKKSQESIMGNPLQRYELAQLKLIGIMSNIPVPRAMIEDPTGKGWIVKAGTNIGKHFGKVKKIGEESIIVVEEYHDRFGKLTINEVELTMESSVAKE